MNQATNSKLAIKIDTLQNTSSFKFHIETIAIPGLSKCKINNLQISLNKNGEESLDEQDKKSKYTGGISGIFSVPEKHFSKKFSFNVPFSFKHETGIALSFSTNDFSNDKLTLLNQFVFGDEKLKPIIITKDIAVEIVSFLIESAKGFQKLKNYWEKAMEFITKNNISFNIFIDPVEKKYQVGFFWQEFKLDGMPQEIKIKDVIFGLSVNHGNTENKFALKIGGKGQFTTPNKTQSNIYIQYSYSTKEQRLELGGTISVLTSLLELLSVQIPDQIKQYAKNTTLSVEWVSDPKKKITQEMKRNGK